MKNLLIRTLSIALTLLEVIHDYLEDFVVIDIEEEATYEDYLANNKIKGWDTILSFEDDHILSEKSYNRLLKQSQFAIKAQRKIEAIHFELHYRYHRATDYSDCPIDRPPTG